MLITQTIRRDYWVHMFHNFPHQMGIGEPGKCLKLKFEDIQWNERQNELFAAFEDARTGFPFIDAMVTELKTRGDVRHWARLCLGNLYFILRPLNSFSELSHKDPSRGLA